MKTPGELLEQALFIVEKDLNHIKTLVLMGKLDPDSSEDVARYIRALAISGKIKSESDEDQSRTAQRLSDEELLQIVKKMNNKSNEAKQK